jgi:hypothetical protein
VSNEGRFGVLHQSAAMSQYQLAIFVQEGVKSFAYFQCFVVALARVSPSSPQATEPHIPAERATTPARDADHHQTVDSLVLESSAFQYCRTWVNSGFACAPGSVLLRCTLAAREAGVLLYLRSQSLQREPWEKANCSVARHQCGVKISYLRSPA